VLKVQLLFANDVKIGKIVGVLAEGKQKKRGRVTLTTTGDSSARLVNSVGIMKMDGRV
jgi:hypothetical protein